MSSFIARRATHLRTSSSRHIRSSATSSSLSCYISTAYLVPSHRCFSYFSSPSSSPPQPSPSPLSIRYPRNALASPTHSLGPSPESYFGCNVFDRRAVKRYLTANDYARYVDLITNYKQITPATADSIADALLRWATERGATHFTHWFQPITGATAEKHDTFVDTMRDGETPLTRFTGKQLIQGEPDGSSFPSGGLRATHIARGYTGWDPHSPPFIQEHGNGATLYIPSCFFSWDNGKALDEKIPLLRSEVALQRETLRLYKILGNDKVTHVHMDAGLEQEFFLIDRKYYLQRPDLMAAGRTVVGCLPPKGQELEDQYFGSISTRFLDCIHDFEVECWKLGIPVQTRHREVSPGQYEVAPKFAPANVATDRNVLLMEVLRKTARKHDLAALIHEKPFKGINGSGKHNNYSFGTNEIPTLFNPGPVPEENASFMLFLAATIRALDKHADLMRVAISGPGNDHRLGANEAPPAIVSVYLGDDIENSVNRFIGEGTAAETFKSEIELGISALPNLHRVPTDRNRTSTFAFTGNKFEFRAVGSSHNPSRSCQVLNTIIAESIRDMATEIESLIKGEKATVASAMHAISSKALNKHRRVVFNGNGYSEEWQQEAARRQLPNFKSTPSALDTYYTPKNVELFESLKVLDRTELAARAQIMYEDYIKRLCIEVKVLITICQQSITPVVLEYQNDVATALDNLKEHGSSSSSSSSSSSNGSRSSRAAAVDGDKPLTALYDKLTSHLNSMLVGVEALKKGLEAVHHQSSASASAHYCEDVLIPLMHQVRTATDELEQLVPGEQWPLPTYHRMLFHQD